MHVGRIMHTQLVTLSRKASFLEAQTTMKKNNIAHLLIVDKHGKLEGVLSDRDLKQSWASQATTLSVHELNYLLDKLTVDSIMKTRVITATPDTTIERAAHILQSNKISSLPIIEYGKLVGIITTNDVLGVILQAIGIDGESVRLSILVKDSVGVMADVTNTLKDKQVNIRSFFTWPEKEFPDIYQLVMRVDAKDGERAIEALTRHGYKVMTGYVKNLSPYMPDEAARRS